MNRSTMARRKPTISVRFARSALGVVIFAWSTGAQAAPGLGDKVYDPYVRPGVTEIELRSGRLTGKSLNGESAIVLEAEYGFNDRVSGALLVEFENHAGENAKVDAFALESVIYLGQIPKLGIDAGLYFEYEQRIHNESGVGEAKLLFAKQAGPYQGLFNVVVSRPFTDKPGEATAAFSYAASLDREVWSNLRLGVEAFGDLGSEQRFGGRQEHYIGPMAKWALPLRRLGGELEFEAAYLFAAGAARDTSAGQARLLVEWERRW